MTQKIKRVQVWTDNGYLLGSSVEFPKGWLFLPRVSGRRTSTKHRDDPYACIPAWALRLGSTKEIMA